jgi:hypothetical protein
MEREPIRNVRSGTKRLPLVQLCSRPSHDRLAPAVLVRRSIAPAPYIILIDSSSLSECCTYATTEGLLFKNTYNAKSYCTVKLILCAVAFLLFILPRFTRATSSPNSGGTTRDRIVRTSTPAIVFVTLQANSKGKCRVC